MSKDSFIWAADSNGNISKCYADEENRGKGRCNHVLHQNNGESLESFSERVEKELGFIKESAETPAPDYYSPDGYLGEEEITLFKENIDAICGCEVTTENWQEVWEGLSNEKKSELLYESFLHSSYFSFPITGDQDYEKGEIETGIFFSNMWNFGLGAKPDTINSIFDKIGKIITPNGEMFSEDNYLTGISPESQLNMMFSVRKAQVNKTVSVRKPGYMARKLFYGLSYIKLIDDCGDNEGSLLTCKGVKCICKKCLANDMKGANPAFVAEVMKCDNIGGLISTSLSEPLTQSYLDSIHFQQDKKESHEIICNTFDGNSEIIDEALASGSQAEARKIIASGLKKCYQDCGCEILDCWVNSIAKAMTEYDDSGNLIEDPETAKPHITSMLSLGNKGNVFKKASLGGAYTTLSKLGKKKIDPRDSFYDLSQLRKKKE